MPLHNPLSGILVGIRSWTFCFALFRTWLSLLRTWFYLRTWFFLLSTWFIPPQNFIIIFFSSELDVPLSELDFPSLELNFPSLELDFFFFPPQNLIFPSSELHFPSLLVSGLKHTLAAMTINPLCSQIFWWKWCCQYYCVSPCYLRSQHTSFSAFLYFTCLIFSHIRLMFIP